MGKKCAVCIGELSPDVSWPKCCQCLGMLHFKCTNGAMHHQSWNSFSQQTKDEWTCPSCLSMSPTRKHDLSTSSNENDDLNGTKKQCLESDVLMKISNQLANLQTLPSAVKTIDENIQEIKQDNAVFKVKLEQTGERVSVLEIENEKLRQRLDEIEESHETNLQYQLRNNVVISNVPENPGENVEEIVHKLCDFLNVPVKDYDIVRTHRLPKNRKKKDGTVDNSPANLIVKFHHYETKSKIMMEAIKKSPKTSIFGDQLNSRIYLNHHLTKKTRELFMTARFRLKKQNNWHSVSCHGDGKIQARRAENSKPQRIQKITDIDRLLQ